MNLHTLLSARLIKSPLEGHTKQEVIEELIDVLDRHKKLSDKKLASKDVLAREKILSTGMENGLAVPHAKTDAVKELVIAFGLHVDGLAFESLDDKPAHFIFLVLSPRDTSGPHIQALAQISRVLKSEQIRNALLDSSTPDQIVSILANA